MSENLSFILKASQLQFEETKFNNIIGIKLSLSGAPHDYILLPDARETITSMKSFFQSIKDANDLFEMSEYNERYYLFIKHKDSIKQFTAHIL